MPEENFWTLWCNGRLTEADKGVPFIKYNVDWMLAGNETSTVPSLQTEINTTLRLAMTNGHI